MGAPNLPAAFFVSQDIVEREVKLADGSVHKLFFREPSAMTSERWQFALIDREQERTQEAKDAFFLATASMISEALVEADGTPALTIEQACNLKLPVKAAIFKIIRERLDSPGKPSREGERSGPGTSSRATSVGAASRNGKGRSRAANSSDGSISTNSRGS